MTNFVILHPNGVLVVVTLLVIAMLSAGAFIATRDLERRLTNTVFRTNALTTYATSLHIKDFLESRASGVRSLAGILAVDTTFSERVKTIDGYFQYLKTQKATAALLLSPDGKVIYSTDKEYAGLDYSQSPFWKYVLGYEKRGAEAKMSANPSVDLPPILPFVGNADTTDLLLVGSPIFSEKRNKQVYLSGGVVIVINQFAVVPRPRVVVLDPEDTTSRIAIGLMTQSGFPFIHLWSNVPSWNRRSVKVLQTGGRSTCGSCHTQGDIDSILGGTSELGTGLVKNDFHAAAGERFLWTSTKLTSSNIVLMDSVWYVVMSVDRGPVQSSVTSYARGLIFISGAAIVFLVIILTLGFYAYRRSSLERQRAEHMSQVAAVREQYEMLIEKSNDGIYILVGKRIAFANKRFEELCGYTFKELTEIDFSLLIAPEHRMAIMDWLDRSVRGEKVESRFVFVAMAKDGKRIPVEVSVSPVQYDGTVRTLGIVRDLSEITAQKQLYENLFKHAPIGLGIYRDLRVIKVNETASELLGYDRPEDLIGAHIFSFVHPDMLPIVVGRVKRATESHLPTPPIEEKFIKRDGTTIEVLVLSQPVVYEGAEAVQIAFVSLEDRKKLEENLAREAALQEQQKLRLDTLLQSLNEGIMFQSPDGIVEFANGELCRIFGLDTPNGIIGLHFSDVLARMASKVGASGEFIDRVTRQVDRKELVKSDRMELEDGTIVERSALPIFDLAGQYIGRIGIYRDVTTREQKEETIKRLQRTELLGRLAGGIAHDFNNVLAVIIGSLQMILRKSENPTTVQDNTQRALSSAMRGAEVAKRLLQFVRYSPEGFRVFSIRQIIDETVSIIKHTFEENITVHTEFVLHDAMVFGAPGDMQQVLINLANNARDAMPDGGTITFSLTKVDRKKVEQKLDGEGADEYILVMVQDTGSGIDADKLDRIFDPFFTTKEVGKGTGLGLSIVQTIVSAHNGTIDVRSSPEKGTTFLVYLPIVRDGAHAAESSSAHEKADEPGDLMHTATILVVEDEPALRELLSEFLSDKGLNVITAADGEEGLEIFRNHPEISIVLSDLGLPKLSGDRMIMKMKELRSELKCILATGYLTQDADGILSETDVRKIMKPYNLTAIHAMISDSLSD